MSLDLNLPFLAFLPHWDDRYTPSHPAIGFDEVSQTSCLGWIFLISASQVARFKGVSHRHLTQLISLYPDTTQAAFPVGSLS
jgi:hypothetical protein